MRLYMMVSKDKYELPLAVADSVRELAEMTGGKENSIRTFITKYEHGAIKNSRYRRVDIDEDLE